MASAAVTDGGKFLGLSTVWTGPLSAALLIASLSPDCEKHRLVEREMYISRSWVEEMC